MSIAPDGRVQKSVDVETPGGPMVHDMAFTDTYALLFDLPVTFDLEAAMGGSTFPYAWNNDYGVRHRAAAARAAPRPPARTSSGSTSIRCYFYHPLNAYDLDDGQVVLDAVRYETMFNKNRQGPNEGASRLERWTLDPAEGKVLAATLDDHLQEFPRLNEAFQGQRNRYGYGATFGSLDAGGGPRSSTTSSRGRRWSTTTGPAARRSSRSSSPGRVRPPRTTGG